MPTNIRQLGVHAINAPLRAATSVTASAFNIGGILGQFQRKYNQAMLIQSMADFQKIFGANINPNWYGYDAVTLFWKNLQGTSGQLYIQSYVGNPSGSSLDAVVASANVADQSSVNTLQMQAAYQGILEYGTSGNLTAFQITRGYRFSSTLSSAVTTSATSAILTSVSGIQVGDLVSFVVTGGGGGTVYKSITAVNQSTNTISWAGVFNASLSGNIGDAVNVEAFRIQTFRQDYFTGTVTEVEVALGKVWCTLSPTVSQFYVQNVHAANSYLQVTNLNSASSLQLAWPSTGSQTFLVSGADGTQPTTATQWSPFLTNFNQLPIRFLSLVESSSISIQKSVETYSKGRTDNPYVITVLPQNQTQSQLITTGGQYQRSDDVLQVNVADWVGITDPFNLSPNAPDRYTPNAGAVMGAWVRSVALLGIHYIPAVDQIVLTGINSLNNSNLGTVTDDNRTTLASYGVNLIQNVAGSGFRIRNFFTPSTTLGYMFANGLLMRNFIKVSSESSLQSSENYPNSFARINSDKNAISNFLLGLWTKGSTGSVPTGETFGQQQNTDGTLTKFTDHVDVRADAINNPQSSINQGNRNIDVAFTYPTPAGSIIINVGILLR